MRMNYRYQLKDLSVTHNAIADWLIANPGKGQMGKCAAVFGISPAWLSTITQSDAFQALLKSKQEKTYQEVIIPLQDKIAGVAHAAVEKLGEVVNETNDGRLVKDVADSMLNKLGYGAKATPAGEGAGAPGTTINNTLIVADRAALAEARALQSQYYGRTLEGPSEANEAEPEEPPLQLPSSEEPSVGSPSELRAEIANSESEVHRDAETGGEVRGSDAELLE